MLQLVYLLPMAEAALMRGDQFTFVVDPDGLRIAFDTDHVSDKADRYRVAVGPEVYCGKCVHPCVDAFGGFKAIAGKCVQVFPVGDQHLSDRSRLAFDLMFLVTRTPCQEQRIQFSDVPDPRDRDHDVSPGPAYKTFYEAFLMALGGIAEDCVKSVVCRQSSISCLFPGTGSETVLHSNLPIIEDHSGRDTAEQVKSPDERVEKTFFVLPVVSKNDRPAAVTQPRTEEIYCLSVSIYVHLCLAPVDLHRFTRIELERDESIRMGILQFMYFGTDRRFSSSESSFLDEPVVDPFGGMFLFRKAFRFVFFQALPDKVNSFICECCGKL